MHYHSFEEARAIWNMRKARINRDNLFVIFSFYDDVEEDWLKRFDKINLKNKIAFVNRPFPQYKSAYYISGNEEIGLQLLNEYVNLLGKRKYDNFNFVDWFNQN